MSADRRGNPVHDVASNRAPFYEDGVGNLQATTVARNIIIKDVKGVNAIATKVIVRNVSGQDADLTFTVATTIDAKQEETMTEGGVVPNGAQMEFPIRAIRINEKNVGAGTQTGRGVVYWCILEPGHV